MAYFTEDKLLNFKENLMLFLEPFINFYGISRAYELKEKFEKIEFLFLRDMEYFNGEQNIDKEEIKNLETKLRECKSKINTITSNMVNNFCNDNKIIENYKRQALFNGRSYNALPEDLNFFECYYQFLYENNDEKIKEVFSLLIKYKLLTQDDMKNIKLNNLDVKQYIRTKFKEGCFKELDVLVSPFLEMMAKYNEEIKKIYEEQERLKMLLDYKEIEEKNIKENINLKYNEIYEKLQQIYIKLETQKYFPVLVDEFKEYIPDDEYKNYTKDIKNGFFVSMDKYPAIKEILGGRLEEHIMLNNEEINKKVNATKIILREKLYSNLVQYLPDMISFKEKLKKEEFIFLDCFEGLEKDFCGLVVTNYKKNNDSLEMCPTVLVKGAKLNDYNRDSTVIHELNHALEESILYMDQKLILSISGWAISAKILEDDKLSLEDELMTAYEYYESLSNGDKKILEECQIEQKFLLQNDIKVQDLEEFIKGYKIVPEQFRQLYVNSIELKSLNEAVNDLITYDICRQCDKLDFDEELNIKLDSGYSYMFPITIEFYETYKKEIIESRINGNIELMFKTVGKDNFFAFAKLVEEFRIYSKSDSNKYREMMEKKDKILENMSEYNKNRARN